MSDKKTPTKDGNIIWLRCAKLATTGDEGIIKYLGYTEDVKPFLSNTDCFILPSFYGEGAPRSLLEAASMAIPIITTDNVGCRAVVKNGVNGYLCPPKT